MEYAPFFYVSYIQNVLCFSIRSLLPDERSPSLLQDDFLPRMSTTTIAKIWPMADRTDCFCRYGVTWCACSAYPPRFFSPSECYFQASQELGLWAVTSWTSTEWLSACPWCCCLDASSLLIPIFIGLLQCVLLHCSSVSQGHVHPREAAPAGPSAPVSCWEALPRGSQGAVEVSAFST
jgi:hypothetical protein